MKCPKCENIYPPIYKVCVYCNILLVRELFAPQIQIQKQEQIQQEILSQFVENGDLDNFEKD